MTEPSGAPFDPSNAIGDPGRQAEVRAKGGPANVGVPDTALDFLTHGPLEVRACSSRGWSHRFLGTPRQDSFCLWADDRVLVIGVADGVSESPQSQVAAETGARSAVKLAADAVARAGNVDWANLSRRVSLRIIDEAEYRQIASAAGDNPSIEDRLRATRQAMATTLIVAVIRMTPTPEGFPCEVGVVAGDSAAYVLSDGSLRPVSGGKDQSGPITSSHVRPLPGAVEPESVHFHLRPGEALVVGTDGIGDIVGDGTGEAALVLAERWAQPPTIDRFLCDVNAYRRTFDDDRTAVAVWVSADAVLPAPPAVDPLLAVAAAAGVLAGEPNDEASAGSASEVAASEERQGGAEEPADAASEVAASEVAAPEVAAPELAAPEVAAPEVAATEPPASVGVGEADALDAPTIIAESLFEHPGADAPAVQGGEGAQRSLAQPSRPQDEGHGQPR